MGQDVQQHRFGDRDSAAQALANQVSDDLIRTLEQAKETTLIVSGGSSPIGVFHALRAKPLPWDRVSVVVSDERDVPIAHADSNAGMVKRNLLKDAAARARQVDLLPEPGSTDLGRVEERLSKLPKPVAHAMLGMGTDGHTASLFPTVANLDDALSSERACVYQRVPGMDVGRISLTPRALLSVSQLSLLVFGEEKLQVLQQAIQPGPRVELPIRVILHQDKVPVDIYWAP
jgi:6-phosphogluconolactonase